MKILDVKNIIDMTNILGYLFESIFFNLVLISSGLVGGHAGGNTGLGG